MHSRQPGGFIRQRRVITMRCLVFLLLLVAVTLAAGVVLVVVLPGLFKLFGTFALIATLVLIYQILILLYTCIDHSEFQIRELRHKLAEAARSQHEMPLAVQAALVRISEDRHTLITYARAQRDVELNNMVARIIDGNFSSLEQINQALRPFSLGINGRVYILALFHTLEIPDDAFDLNIENSLREFGYPNPLAAFFRTIIGEMFGMSYKCLISERNGIFRCIVYSADDVQPSCMEDEVYEISTKIISIFKDCLSITMLGAVGQARTDFGALRISNDELTRLMECRSFIESTLSI